MKYRKNKYRELKTDIIFETVSKIKGLGGFPAPFLSCQISVTEEVSMEGVELVVFWYETNGLVYNVDMPKKSAEKADVVEIVSNVFAKKFMEVGEKND